MSREWVRRQDARPVSPPLPVRLPIQTLLRSRYGASVPPAVYWRIVSWFRERYAVSVPGYETPVHPYRPLELPPDAVQRLTGRTYPPWENRFESLGAVSSGGWDSRPLDADPAEHPTVRLYGGTHVRETTLYRSLSARFERGVAWEDTALFDVLTEEFDTGRSVWHDCRTVADARERCARLDALYERMRAEGYRSQLELVRRAGVPPVERPFADVMRNEVAVDIGRNGDPLLVEGRHRLILADLLDLDTVTVVVYVRHTDWMETRDAVAVGRTAGTDARTDHPDLQGL